MAIVWDRNEQLEWAVQNCWELFAGKIGPACSGTIEAGGDTYDLTAEDLAQLRSDTVGAFVAFKAAVTALQDHYQE